MVWSAYMGLPLSLKGVGAVLQLERQKLDEGKDLIKYFSQPCSPTKTNGGRTRNLPIHAPDKWQVFKTYNIRDVEVELAIQAKLQKFPVPDSVWDEYHLDQEINDRGVALDLTLVNNALEIDAQSTTELTAAMRDITDLDKPNSVQQMKQWLSENGMDLDRKTFRETYCLHGGDWYHLSPSGHALFAPIISRWLENTLYPGSRFYDLASVPAYMRSAVLSMVDDGILYGTDTHLFSPTRAVTRAELAQALYRMEGSPDAYQWDLADVDYDAPAYDAVCWCLDEGLFSAGDWFEPDAIVTREMLATVLYRYYTDYCEGFVSTTVGLGTYRDGRDVSSYAKIPFGWSLSSGVLSEQDGMLHPAGAVSRGQLAIALRNLLNYL